MKPEIYTNVNLSNLGKLIGFGPGIGNIVAIPLVVQSETGAIVACRAYQGPANGINSDVYFPDRNYILPDELDNLGMDSFVKGLLTGKNLVITLGNEENNQRSFVWKKEESNFLAKNRISLNDGIRLKEGRRIVRLSEVYSELLKSTDSEDVLLVTRLQSYFRGEKNITQDIASVINESEICLTIPCRRKALDEEDDD